MDIIIERQVREEQFHSLPMGGLGGSENNE